ncbi:MAG: hypothetical protein ACK521_03395 [bacterium]
MKEEQNATLSGIWSFIFLELTLLCRLITCTLILAHVMGLDDYTDGMPVFYLRIFYYLSVVFFSVSVSLGIYEWLLIIHRVNFFGGIITRRDYTKRARDNRVIFVVVATGVSVINVGLIFAQAIDPTRPTCLALTMTILVVFSAMLITFTVVGAVLISRLDVLFRKNYAKQRTSILTALILLIGALITLATRFGLEYAYLEQTLNVALPTHFEGLALVNYVQVYTQTENKFHVPVALVIIFLFVSDVGPILVQMTCIWLANKGEWIRLIQGFLEASECEEVGSVILDDLRVELNRQRFPTELLDTENLSARTRSLDDDS